MLQFESQVHYPSRIHELLYVRGRHQSKNFLQKIKSRIAVLHAYALISSYENVIDTKFRNLLYRTIPSYRLES